MLNTQLINLVHHVQEVEQLKDQNQLDVIIVQVEGK